MKMDDKEILIFLNDLENKTPNNQVPPIESPQGTKTYTNLEPRIENNPSEHEDYELVDQELADLLSSWGFVDLYGYFVSMNMSVKRLQIIDNDDLKELFANKDFGVKVEFKHKLYQWRKQNGYGTQNDLPEQLIDSIKNLVDEHLKNLNTAIPNHSRTPSPSPSSPSSICSNISNPPSPSIGFINFDIDAILGEQQSGMFVLGDYKKNKRIGDSSRSILIDCISSWLIRNYKTVSRREFAQIAEKIQDRFGEDKNIYFAPPPKGTKENPSGRLYSRFYNAKRRYRQIGIDFIEDQPSEKTSFSIAEIEAPEETEVTLADVKWLQLNKEPWDEVKEKWRKTHGIRQKQIQTLKFPEILINWPLLKHSAGITLVDIDFGLMYNGKENRLIEKWDQFKSIILPVFNDKVKDKNCLELLGSLNKQNFAKGPEDFIIFQLLHALLPPSSRQTAPEMKEGQKKRKFFKPTIKDSQQSFILPVTQANNFNPAIDRLAEKVRDYGQSLQPFIIFCSFDTSFVVYFNEIKYKFCTLLAAVDTCFKIFFVLNLEYPVSCKSVWIFIEKYFYEIESKKRIPADAIVLIDTLKQRQNV